jgi:hypothetical protein
MGTENKSNNRPPAVRVENWVPNTTSVSRPWANQKWVTDSYNKVLSIPNLKQSLVGARQKGKINQIRIVLYNDSTLDARFSNALVDNA